MRVRQSTQHGSQVSVYLFGALGKFVNQYVILIVVLFTAGRSATRFLTYALKIILCMIVSELQYATSTHPEQYINVMYDVM